MARDRPRCTRAAVDGAVASDRQTETRTPFEREIPDESGRDSWRLAVASYSWPWLADDLPTPRLISRTCYRVHVCCKARRHAKDAAGADEMALRQLWLPSTIL